MRIDSNKFEKISGKGLKIGIVVSTWNNKITNSLYSSAKKTLLEKEVRENDIIKIEVPGSFELIYGARKMAKKNVDSIIVFGSVIKGETPHFDFICNSVSQGIKDLNIKLEKPIIFGLLTDLNIKQAIERSSGKKNKGIECAIAAIKMALI